MVSKTVFFVVILIMVTNVEKLRGEKELTLAIFLNGVFNNHSEFIGGQTYLAALEMALELVNDDPSLLRGYRLNASISDDQICFQNATLTRLQCSGVQAVRSFYQQITDSPTKIMIIGADCSVSSTPIATLAPYWNLVQISTLSTSPLLEDTSTYPNFLRVISSDGSIVSGLNAFMKYFAWTRMAVVVQQETIFTSVLTNIRKTFKSLLLADPTEFTFNANDNISSTAVKISESSRRIILIEAYPSYTANLLCQCYHRGLTLKNGYVWILLAWYQDGWWNDYKAATELKCSINEMEDMLLHSFSIDHLPFLSADEVNIPTDIHNLSRARWDQLLQDRLKQRGATATSLFYYASYIVDAIWAAALGLNATYGNGTALENFTYESAQIAASIRENIITTSFRGMTGNVTFNIQGARPPKIRLLQYRWNNLGKLQGQYQIGILNLNGELQLQESINDIFPNGVPQDENKIHISSDLFASYAALSCLGIALSVGFLFFNLVFAKRRVVKLSSPYMNILIITGVILFYVDVILLGIDESLASTFTVTCLCSVCLSIESFAFTLVFGTIFAKTWRVYYIFSRSLKHRKIHKKLIKDGVLLAIVGCGLLVDLIFLTAVIAIPSARLTIISRELPQNGPALPKIVHLCSADDKTVWLSVLLAYKGVLLVLGTFLAWETRQVNIPQLNDSKMIGASVYGIVVVAVALTVISLLLKDAVNENYSIVGGCILLGNTSLLCILFGPKVYNVWKNSSITDTLEVENSTEHSSNAKKESQQLQDEINSLKRELEEYKSAGYIPHMTEVSKI